jgi:sterol desaturase/sphingolipid hydroxylase (fatty acid hydroxylase superfamily)
MPFILEYEAVIRLGFFVSVFVLMALWEMRRPARELRVSKALRWGNNLALVVLNSVLLRWLFPVAATGMAAFAQQQGWGLLNYYPLPFALAVVVSVIALDFVIWLQHVMVHAIPLLWRLHRVHHADLDYDVTTGARFHPLEIILSMLIKFASILLLGPPLLAVLIFEVLLNASAMFNHGNVRLSAALERWLRLIMVTPDMHRVHHSVEDDEANSNFGFNLPWWDRLFGTYREQPRADHRTMRIGIHRYQALREVVGLPGLLSLPFRGAVDSYAINRRRWNDKDSV